MGPEVSHYEIPEVPVNVLNGLLPQLDFLQLSDYYVHVNKLSDVSRTSRRLEQGFIFWFHKIAPTHWKSKHDWFHCPLLIIWHLNNERIHLAVSTYIPEEKS